MKKNIVIGLVLLIGLVCAGAWGAPPPDAARLSLKPGDYYFTLRGKQAFVFGRNATGPSANNHYSIIGWEAAAGGSLIRIHLTHGFGFGITPAGKVDARWLATWDAIFERAAKAGLSVIPVFGVWADWNNDGLPWSNWKNNPLAVSKGGPGTAPVELLRDTRTQAFWLGWMTELATHWKSRWNIAAWEVFSEMNLISGSTETEATAFLAKAAAVIRAADPAKRPVTASLAGDPAWSAFEQSPDLEILQIHPYGADLDLMLLSQVAAKRDRFHKPVLIGEAGLSAAGPESAEGALTVNPNAAAGIRHAVWAAIVSGAMNGRSLWWEDSYAVYSPTIGFPFAEKYKSIEEPAARFAANVDFSGFRPVAVALPPRWRGGVIGNPDSGFLGWFRDSSSAPPDWPADMIESQTISFAVPGDGRAWRVEFYDPQTGKSAGTVKVVVTADMLSIALPAFSDAIALKVFPALGAAK